MIDIPRARRGAARRSGDVVAASDRVAAHVSLPGWIAGPLYQRARREHRTVSGVAATALVAYLGVDEPEEATGT